jgi:hypothetical protein
LNSNRIVLDTRAIFPIDHNTEDDPS